MNDMTAISRDPLRLYLGVQAFLFKEARLQDSHDYDGWDALWDDDAIYWVPANSHDIDPDKEMSIIYDNRSRIRVRINQLKTGRRHTQTPRSELARIVSNIEILDVSGDEVTVAANVLIYEDNLRGQTIWAARNTYGLRWGTDDYRLFYKKVALVNAHKPIYTMSFLV